MRRTGVKSTSATGLFFRRQALALATKVARVGGAAHQVFDLFLLRAKGDRAKQVGKATIIEVPPLLLGGFGGRDGVTPLYVPSVAISMGALVDALLRPTAKLDPGSGLMVPLKGDDFVLSYPLGDGRVVVGAPDWSVARNALNDSTGVYSLCPSAITIAVCPDLTGGGRTLLVCRTSPAMMPGLKTDATGAVLPGQDLELPPDNYPAISGAVPTGRAERISGVEFGSAAVLASEYDLLNLPGACVEWGPLRGLASFSVLRYDAGSAYLGDGVHFLRYAVSDAGAGAAPRYTGAVVSNHAVQDSTLPSADQPDPVSAVTPPNLYPELGAVFPPWAELHLCFYGREASAGVMRVPRDINQTTRVWGTAVGTDVATDQPALALVEVTSSHDSAAVIDVEGFYLDGGAPGGFGYVTSPMRANMGLRYLTYAVSLPVGGVPVLRKLGEFVDARYETAGALERYSWQAFGGVNAADGSARLVCVRRKIEYSVRPAEPDMPEVPWVTARQQGEPARRLPTAGSDWVQPSELTLWLVGADADVQVSLPAHFPALGHLDVTTVGVPPANPGRQFFGDSALRVTSPRYGNNFPLPCCQYAPDHMLLLAHPLGQFANDVWNLSLLVVKVSTGAVVQTVNSAVQVTYNTRLSVTCVEQATVDAEGAIASHGTLMLSVSSPDNTSTRRDGIYMVHRMSSITWLAREPSNVAAVYAGNALVPATLGVSTNLLSAPKV